MITHKTSVGKLATFAVASALVLTACGGGGAQPTSPPAATTAPQAPAATSAPATTSAPAATKAPAATTAATAAGAAATSPAATTAAGATSAPAASTAKFPVEDNAAIVFSGWGDASEQKVWQDSIARFNKVYPNVKITYNAVPQDFQTKMKAAFSAGSGTPDVLYVDADLMTALGRTGQLLALDDYMAAAGVNKSDYIETLLPEFTYNGKLYAVPKDFGTLGLIYRPKAFKDAGVAEPTNDWTLDDMAKAAKAVTKGPMAGFCMGPDWARFAPAVFEYGGDFTTPDFKTATFNSPEAVQAAQYFADMKNKDKSLVQPSDVGAGWCGEALAKEQVAMTWEGGWLVPFMKDYKDVEYKIVNLPKGPKGSSDILFTNGLGVSAKTKFPKAASALAFYLTGKENQAAIEQTGFALPIQKSLLDPNDPYFKANPNQAAIAYGATVGKLAFWGPNTGPLQDDISKSLERVWLGQQDVKPSLDQGVQKANQDLAK